ncbi:MAG: undecaprenyldiphospho-muramoylpentapeptide beta-N-acetylglucosaminyltransferase [Clostridiales bacterium]|jgi:UDP-N-acetylglucosamine--N-acetylmuramyl-(pentapeptide) pyrophosphoryl-undecaprenol N-acetylglucosamine transferase|nr:undecaprenyldiphospho-muramoylpentapeptide beta-N-acetylglucosaminyltransferase [Clostridiales bacterium]
MKRIVLTGGGTAGHVTPNIALVDELKKAGYEINYIGSYDGIEKKLITEQGITYYPISSGKLRRYFALKNISDPFKVIKGYFEAKKLIKKIKPDVVFSKGGYVSVPVIFAASRKKIPVIIHESDMTPGLANKLSIPKATKVCTNFAETLQYIPTEKGVHTGTPIRVQLLKGDKENAKKICGFHTQKPVLLIIGGSLGSVKINETVRNALEMFLKQYNIIHICGKGNISDKHKDLIGYFQIEYAKNELSDLFALSDLVISRAGANVICELLALKKPTLLIPLSTSASRGDQILNAESFRKHGYSAVLLEEELTPASLVSSIDELYERRGSYMKEMSRSEASNAIEKIVKIIVEVTK